MSTKNFVSNDNATQLFEKVGQELDKKQDTLTFDIMPTESSINPVTSGGVYQNEKLLDDYKLDKTDTMPEASADLEGTPVIYVGETNSTYTKGHIYECQEITPSTTPKTYEWVDIGTSGGITVDSAMSATSTNPVQNKVVNSAINEVDTKATNAASTASSAASTASSASTNASNALTIERSTSSFPTGDAYSSSSSYKVGDHVIYNNKLYRCKTACSAGSWATNQSNFEQTTLTKAVTTLNNELTQKINYYGEKDITVNVAGNATQYIDTGVPAATGVFGVLTRFISTGANAVFFNFSIGGNGNIYVAAHNFDGNSAYGTAACYFLQRVSSKPL